MKNWIKDVRVRCIVNSRVAKVRAIKRCIRALEIDICDNQDRIVAMKKHMALIDGNQMDLFIPEKREV